LREVPETYALDTTAHHEAPGHKHEEHRIIACSATVL
jgi:hypothetical protein